MQENSTINLERWKSLSLRYRGRFFFTDDYGRNYLIMHNDNHSMIHKNLLKFKYSKISLDYLVRRMENKPEVPRDYISQVKEFYKDKSDVSTIPLHLLEIRDMLMDADCLIKYVNDRGVDWEIITESVYNSFNPKQKKILKKRNRSVKKELEDMSIISLKAELDTTKFKMAEVIDDVNNTIEKLKSHDRTK